MIISAVIIAKDEEKKIGDCIRSLSFADEVIVVDNDSKDKTREIASGLGARIFEYSASDFAKLRMFGAEKAKGEWILYIDADERPDNKLLAEVKKATARKDFNAYFLKRRNYFFGKRQPGFERMVRLVRKDHLSGWKGKVHETMVFGGVPGELEGFLDHHTHDDIKKMLEKTNSWSGIEAELLFRSSHPIMTVPRFLKVMFSAFFSSYVSKGGWRYGKTGVIEALYQSYSVFITYAKLYELQTGKKDG